MLLGFIIDLLDCFFVACVFVDDYIVVLNELYHCSLCQNLTFLTASRSKHAHIFLELVLSSLGVQIFRCYFEVFGLGVQYFEVVGPYGGPLI